MLDHPTEVRRGSDLPGELRKAPEGLLCPICEGPLKDPQAAEDGNSYCRSCIEEWFRTYERHNASALPGEEVPIKSPKTDKPLESKKLVPNAGLRQVGDAYVELVLEVQELYAHVRELRTLFEQAEADVTSWQERADKLSKQNIDLQNKTRILEEELMQNTEQAARLAFHFQTVKDELEALKKTAPSQREERSRQLLSATSGHGDRLRIEQLQTLLDEKERIIRQQQLENGRLRVQAETAQEAMQTLRERSDFMDQQQKELEAVKHLQFQRAAEQRRQLKEDAEKRLEAQRFVGAELQLFSQALAQRGEMLEQKEQMLASKERQLAELQKENDKMKSYVADMRRMNRDLQSHHIELEAEVEQLRMEAKSLKTTLGYPGFDDLGQEIDRVRTELKENPSSSHSKAKKAATWLEENPP
eukprot:TRINITY_DN111992_c0_g1_i1.p1 TRINITY_DN111992_c0_g1~~TRINITY_DN111992_c0_g1_i1.p1  ORF type:complete len:416 (+),score=153.47 TRINITY_DN111992_c0_g1_i1:68-1315(+)